MNRLIINTANKALELVLRKQDEVFSCVTDSSVKHNEAMLPLLDKLLKQNSLDILDIDEFGVIVGPGSFTGIRVGIATIKAFRDVNHAQARGINNLEYLFRLATNQNPDIETVAIYGSIDSFFVARKVLGQLYIYDRNLSLEELKTISQGKPVGMFEECGDLDCYVVQLDSKVLLDCYDFSSDFSLVPVYYQLSQAEREEIKHSKIEISFAEEKDIEKIADIEEKNIADNKISQQDFQKYLANESYEIFVAKANENVVGFILLEVTDEINIYSIAVEKEYRNIGLASKLVERAKELAREKNIDTISLEVNEKNLRAYLLYEKLGFQFRRERKNYYLDKSSAIEMSLKV